ncbi:hypothetical protein D9M68_921320 [compost metagenome]
MTRSAVGGAVPVALMRVHPPGPTDANEPADELTILPPAFHSIFTRILTEIDARTYALAV